MLAILAKSMMIATGVDPRSTREKVAAQRRDEDEYFWQGRHGKPGDWRGR